MHSKQYFEEKIANLERNIQFIGKKAVSHERKASITIPGLTEGYMVYQSPQKNDAGYIVTKEPWHRAKAIDKVENGTVKSIPNGTFSMFDIGDGDFYISPSTENELKVGVRNSRNRVNSCYQLHLAPLEIEKMSGHSINEYKTDKESMPWFVMRVKVSKNDSFIQLSCPAKTPKGMKMMKGAFAEKYGKSFGFKADDSFDVAFLTKPIKAGNFTLPVHFIRYFEIKANSDLPSHYDSETKTFVFEAPVKICSCCGKPVHSVGEKSCAGLICKDCSETLPLLQDFVTEHIGAKTDRIVAAAQIIAKSGLYPELQKEIENMLKRTEER